MEINVVQHQICKNVFLLEIRFCVSFSCWREGMFVIIFIFPFIIIIVIIVIIIIIFILPAILIKWESMRQLWGDGIGANLSPGSRRRQIL